VCDAAALGAALAADPALAAAWAEAAGVEVSAVGGLLERLTPVVLGRDTAVTNHEYRRGRVRAYQAVLQAGTPVLVDELGTPRVKCACGNPLGAPRVEDLGGASVRGATWEGFRPRAVVRVDPATEPATELTTVDVGSREPVTTPVGAVVLDGYLVDDAAGVHVVGADGRRTTVLDRPVARVADDAAGGLLFNLARPGGGRTMDDLAYEPPADAAQAAVWQLPAAEAEPVQLVAPPEAPQGWAVLVGAGMLGDRRVAAYADLDLYSDGDVGEFGEGPLQLMDLGTGGTSTLAPDAVGYDQNVRAFWAGGDRLMAFGYTGADGLVVIRDATDAPVSTVCDRRASSEGWSDAFEPCEWAEAFDGDGRFVGLATSDSSGAPLASPQVVRYDATTGARVDARALPQLTTGGSTQLLLDVVGARAVVSDPSGGQPAVEMDLETGAVTELGITGRVRILRAPLVRPRAPSSPGSTTTAPPTTAPAPPVDPLNLDLPGTVCPLRAAEGYTAPVPVRNGSGEATDEPGGTPAADDFRTRVETRTDWSAPADVDLDGVMETVMVVQCNNYRVFDWQLAAMRTGPDGAVVVVGEVLSGEYGIGTKAVDAFRMEPDGVVVLTGNAYSATDPLCCPSSTFTDRWRFEGGRWVPGG
jgi:hypothetical protein